MRVAITGSRDWADYKIIAKELLKLPRGSWVFHGDCRGADKIAGGLAEAFGIDVYPLPAPWGPLKNKAGMVRNSWLLDLEPDELWAFPLPQSKGTIGCMKLAEKRGIPVRNFGDTNA